MKTPKHAITLPLRLSTVLAKPEGTHDGRKVDECRREARELALEQARKVLRRTGETPADIEVYACERHGGSLLDVVTVPLGLSL